MAGQRSYFGRIKEGLALDKYGIPVMMASLLVVIIVVVYYTQRISEQTSLPPIVTTSSKEQYEIAKLAAEIRQIRSDTSGSLFWLKMIALFVTVGGAVGGYLVGQSRTAKKRIEFENRRNVDSAYQSIVLELANESPLLRAAAAVKLGTILQSFPAEWSGDESNKDDKRRREQLVQLTKQVLAASLAVESNPKVLKTLTIALALHKPWENEPDPPDDPGRNKRADLSNLDLSLARAADAFWSKVDLTNADLYGANLAGASFRQAVLSGTQLRGANLQGAVLAEAKCHKTNFKLADLRKADLTKATLVESNFEGAKVFGCVLTGAMFQDNPEATVDNSVYGDGSNEISVRDWLANQDQLKKVL